VSGVWKIVKMNQEYKEIMKKLNVLHKKLCPKCNKFMEELVNLEIEAEKFCNQ